MKRSVIRPDSLIAKGRNSLSYSIWRGLSRPSQLSTNCPASPFRLTRQPESTLFDNSKAPDKLTICIRFTGAQIPYFKRLEKRGSRLAISRPALSK
ncbi:hypothetical protein ALQ92_200232 [Pseudomonas syringae pv. pisi]|nr:hypothetical protein ALQ92_200232 [Pseudomonas syringae pv. pisi]